MFLKKFIQMHLQNYFRKKKNSLNSLVMNISPQDLYTPQIVNSWGI